MSDKQLNDAQAAFDQAEAARKSNELLVQYTRVRAPFSDRSRPAAWIRAQNVDVGRELFDIVDRTPLLARISSPSTTSRVSPRDGRSGWRRTRTRPAARSTFRAKCFGSRRSSTRAPERSRSPASSPMKGRAGPSRLVRVKVQTGVHEDVLSIPEACPRAGSAETFVFRTEADSVLKVPIETGFTDADFVEVVEGLAGGTGS
ncbi:MAG: hypothetical protein R3E97_12465 [Candidatus Eisenbacteria bacterium]